ncbi:MAG: hypothetical protein R3B72_38985 [Polyangiaceae bacterium]
MRAERLVLLVGLLAGCGRPGAVETSIPLMVAGTELEAPIEGRDGWSIELSRADLAFGPLYLCSGVKAGDLCETARAEWVDSIVVDVLDPEARYVGDLHGSTGWTRSWMYDLGIVSLLAKQNAEPLSAAEALGGVSLVLEGTASKDGAISPFLARAPIQQEEGTEKGVPVVRKSAADPFEHEITGEDERLLVRFDAASWAREIDFTSASEEGDLEFTSEGQAMRAIRNAVVAGPRPRFEWGEE